MKTKHLFFSLLAACGIALSASAAALCSAQTDDQTANLGEIPITIGMTGLQSGSVDITITDNGKTYFFSASTNGYIGEFPLEGDSFDAELFFNNTSPNFSHLTTSATLDFTQISDTKYHVTVYDKRLTFGEIGLHFGE